MRSHFKIKYAILQTILFTIIGTSGEYANDLKKEAYTGKISVKLRQIIKPGFNQPLDMAVFPEKIKGETYYAVAEKRGVVYLVAQKGSENENIKIVLLDLRKKVCSEGFEQGLLGIAFDPDYKKTHEMFIYYCDCRPNKTILSRVKITSGIKNELPFFDAAESKILEIAQPYSNHKGGHVEFGPDGYLYIGVGDGGSAGDPHGNGQNINSLLGKILRIDVRGTEGYKIPADNPFVKNGRGEIFARGLRNPWRFGIDAKTGLIWVGDVGQNLYEEISIVRKGENQGWNIMEGLHCFSPPKNCDQTNLVKPIYEYSHAEGQSVIGGFVYNGSGITGLKGKYIFGDYATGKIWYIDGVEKPQKKANTLLKTDLYISSFARDDEGEIYVLDINGGFIYKIVKND